MVTVQRAAARKLRLTRAPDDEQIREILLDSASQYGLLTSFTTQRRALRLLAARLVEGTAHPPLRAVFSTLHEDGADHLPEAAHRLAVLVANRLGVELEPSRWSELFD